MEGIPWMTSLVEAPWRLVTVGSIPSARYKAITPATWGEAIEVPEIVLEASGLPIQAEVMATPGAKISTQGP